MDSGSIKNRNRNLFLPLNNQLAKNMKIHEQKLKEYEKYLNYLHFNIINNSMHASNNNTFHAPPSTPVTLAFSHLASPTTNPLCHIDQDYFVNNPTPPLEHVYVGKEANIWGPGQLGLFAKTPNQLETLANTSQPPLEHKSAPRWKNRPTTIQISDAAKLQFSCISSPKSSIPPGFEHQCSPSIDMRDEMFMINRSR